nr:methyl-accepting chemotaxis protein [Paraburkholderia bannensis]
MKIGTRLAAGFGAVLIVLFGISLLGIIKLRTLDDAMVANVDYGAVESRLLAQALSDAQEASAAMRNLIILNDMPRMKDQKAIYDDRIQHYIAILGELDDLFARDRSTTRKEKDLLDLARQARERAAPLVDRAAQLGYANDPSGPDFLMNNAGPALDQWTGALKDLIAHVAQVNATRAQEAHSAYRAARAMMVAMTALAALMATLVGWRITRSVLRELGGEPTYAAGLVSRIAGGDLTVGVQLQAGDNSSLLHSMSAMRDRLVDTIGGIHAASGSIVTASREIATGNTDLSSRTEQQAASLEETAASMGQLTQAVRQNTDNARQANMLAGRASSVANAGDDAVQGLARTIGQINASSGKISEITGVIEGIAFQTNILALNAAVEAARAGEQGRGFAVVASEVRNLAQRSATAAREIKELIASSVALIDGGSKQAMEVSATTAEVKQAIRQVSDLVEEITAASEEQSRGIEQVNEAVRQMDDVTQQNAALVEQATAAAKSLEDQSENLMRAVEVFQIRSQQETVSSAVVRREPSTPSTRPRASDGTAAHKAAALTGKAVARLPVQTATKEAAQDSWMEF